MTTGRDAIWFPANGSILVVGGKSLRQTSDERSPGSSRASVEPPSPKAIRIWTEPRVVGQSSRSGKSASVAASPTSSKVRAIER